MILGQLRIGGENFLRCLSCSEFFKNQVDRNPRAFQAWLAQHHIGSNFDVRQQVHITTLAAIRNALKRRAFGEAEASEPRGGVLACGAPEVGGFAPSEGWRGSPSRSAGGGAALLKLVNVQPGGGLLAA